MIRRLRGRAGVTTVEFAMCGAVLALFYGGMTSLGVLFWGQAALQSVAAETARCVAIGSAACASGQQYAVNLAQRRIFAGVISAANVTISASGACNGATGYYTQVTITTSYWATIVAAPFAGRSVSVSSCYGVHS